MKYFTFLALLLVVPLVAQSPAPGSGTSKAPQGAPAPATTAPTPAQTAPAANQEEPAEKRFKNIKVFTGVPQSQLIPMMQIMRASLGVKCEFCHVPNQFPLDDKKEKQTARQMIQMVFDINKNNFNGRNQVTCNTCHRGEHNPMAIASMTAIAESEREPEAKPAEPLPTAAQIVEKYIDALGGKAALESVHSRVSKGTLLRAKFENPGTPNQKIVNRGSSVPLEVDQSAPNKVAIATQGPQGEVVQVYDGTAGWLKAPNGSRPIPAGELPRIAAQADMQRELKMSDRTARMRVFAKEAVGDRQAYVVGAQSEGGRRERLYFDAQSGLLLRRVTYTPTPIGPDIEQIDYDDYRAVDGVKVPFTVKASYLDDDRNGFTRKFTEIKNNVPVDDAKFAAPAQ